MSSKLCFLPNFVELPKLPLHLPRIFSYFYSMWTVSPTSQWMKIVQIYEIPDCVISNWSAKRLDFTLTFDHATLTNRLSNWYGISGQVQILFSSYLQNRYQSLKIKDILSDKVTLSYEFHRALFWDQCFLPYTLYHSALSSPVLT